ncbi:MAG: hypothetical protein M5U26_08450 [Planctomycetota bacterium]|nr:hypothetical protein [Planctomycetota bacterium]
MDPIDELEDFDWIGFLDQAEAAVGDEGRALAENIARNLAESVRQQRNTLEAAADQPVTREELLDATDLELKPGNERNTKASFETHMRGLFRRVADGLGRKMNSKDYMQIHPDGRPAVRLELDEYASTRQSNLGAHPHDQAMAVPVPPGWETELPFAERLAHLSPKAQAKWLSEYTKRRARGLGPPPFPD